MVDLISKIKKLYPTGVFGSPCTSSDINEAEELISMKFPNDLRAIYLHFNGFTISGYATRIFPLLPRHSGTSTVKMTLFWQNDPYMPVHEDIIFYGTTSSQHNLGVRPFSYTGVIKYGPDFDEPQNFSSNILEAFEIDEQLSLENFGPPPWRNKYNH